MSRATLALVGNVGDVRSRCESLLELLRRLDQLVDGTEEPTVKQEAAIDEATWRWGIGSKDYVDRAFDAVHAWFKQVEEAVSQNDEH